VKARASGVVDGDWAYRDGRRSATALGGLSAIVGGASTAGREMREIAWSFQQVETEGCCSWLGELKLMSLCVRLNKMAF
jgi:hypothetical protein